MEAKKEKGKEKDTMIRISKETRARLKMKALKSGLTLKEYLDQTSK